MELTYILILSLGIVQCLKVVPEYVKLAYYNEKYVESCKVNVRRNGRKGDYCFNLEGTVKETLANNFTVHLVVTQFLHNEYRRSFVELHYKLCDLINKEPYLGGMIKQTGIPCPVLKGKYSLTNMTIQSQYFPNVFPFEKGGAEVELNHTYTNEPVLKFIVHAKFDQDLRKKLPRQ